MESPKCPVCGRESLVTVVSDEGNGHLRQFCQECDARKNWTERYGPRYIAAGVSRILTYAGILLAILALTADHLSISGKTGFGWRQITGTEVGFLCVLFGMLLRRGVLGTFGLFVMVLSLGADLWRVGHVPGLGWRKQTALVIATLLLGGGLYWQRHLRIALARQSDPQPVEKGE
jgi:hypothetical protein